MQGCWLNSEDIALESLHNSYFEVKVVMNIYLTNVYISPCKVRRHFKSNVCVV